MRERFGLALQPLEGYAQIVLKGRVVGLQAYRIAQRLHSGVGLAETQQGHAAATMGRREIGLQHHGATVIGERLGGASGFVQGVGEVDLQEWVAGLKGRRGQKSFDCFRGVANPGERDAQQLERIAIARLDCKKLPVGDNGLGEPPLLV